MNRRWTTLKGAQLCIKLCDMRDTAVVHGSKYKENALKRIWCHCKFKSTWDLKKCISLLCCREHFPVCMYNMMLQMISLT